MPGKLVQFLQVIWKHSQLQIIPLLLVDIAICRQERCRDIREGQNSTQRIFPCWTSFLKGCSEPQLADCSTLALPDLFQELYYD